MNACVLFSGGKDSTYSTYLAIKNDSVKCLLTLIPEREDSYMFHFPNINWTHIQAEASGLPHIIHYTKGEKETELRDLKDALEHAKKKYEVDCVYTGAIKSLYQKKRAEDVCASLGLKCISPLWNVDQENYVRNIVREGFRAVITSVSSLGLDYRWLGRELDQESVEQLVEAARKYNFNPALEGGEGETFVIDCPFFHSSIKITRYEKVWDGYTGRMIIKDAILAKKL